MIKSIGGNYWVYGLIIVKLQKHLPMLDYELSNATFDPLNYAFALNTMFGMV
jgi:hypothetical protein